MNLTIENILLIGSILLLISIVVGKTTYKTGVPTLLFFLSIGTLAGSEGIGKIHFDNPPYAQFIGIIALNFILFAGGLDTNWHNIKPIVGKGISLATIGVFLTALFLGLMTWQLTHLTLYESLLLGSIVSSTDAAAVFSILRSHHLALRYKLRPILELESGSNDPMAYVLTISFLGLVQNPEENVLYMLFSLLKQMIIGGTAGFLFGYASKNIINKITLDFQGLYPVLVISLMFFTFSFTDLIGGNGFLAVYICALYLGNQEFIHKKTVIKFFDGFAWLMQIILFLTLGLLVVPSHVFPVMGIGLLLALLQMFVARPISVLLSLLPFQMNLKAKLYISWVGLRGAVPIVFATYPLMAGIEKAEFIFNIVFFITVVSVLGQGTSIIPVAKWLGVLKREESEETSHADDHKAAMKKFRIPSKNPIIGNRIVDLNFPQQATIALIRRENNYVIPHGNTVLEANDLLIVLAESEKVFKEVERTLHLSQA
ncbi:MAG: potassium/proton antiporter [Cytophagales bacterium]|nr:potassium/proton antiporter [Cytophagales bacterium]MDW8384738.1 potassium/proton antiporter [Flammeovirgaceae bacterium]